MPTEDFKQWQQWLSDKAICENKECTRCKYYIEQYEQRVLKKGQKTNEKTKSKTQN